MTTNLSWKSFFFTSTSSYFVSKRLFGSFLRRRFCYQFTKQLQPTGRSEIFPATLKNYKNSSLNYSLVVCKPRGTNSKPPWIPQIHITVIMKGFHGSFWLAHHDAERNQPLERFHGQKIWLTKWAPTSSDCS